MDHDNDACIYSSRALEGNETLVRKISHTDRTPFHKFADAVEIITNSKIPPERH